MLKNASDRSEFSSRRWYRSERSEGPTCRQRLNGRRLHRSFGPQKRKLQDDKEVGARPVVTASGGAVVVRGPTSAGATGGLEGSFHHDCESHISITTNPASFPKYPFRRNQSSIAAFS